MPDTALVTGAGTGIGAALTAALVARGLNVIAIGRRAEPLEALRDAHGSAVTLLALDVGRDDAPARAAALAATAQTRYVVHNAAVLEPVGPLVSASREALSRHFDTNLFGPLRLTQALLPVLSAPARVLHISSGAAHRALPGWGAYCTSKAALHMLYRAWQLEADPARVRFGSARPGVVDTPMQTLIRSLDEAQCPEVSYFRQLKADGALTTPTEVGRFLSWLLLDADDEQFSAEERDIRDPALRKHW